jgi:membrane associated rhomboid family serine protease
MFPIQDTNPSRSAPIVNWLIILANILIFLGEAATPTTELNAVVRTYGIVPTEFIKHFGGYEVLTIFTSMFMHGGWLHLISNMWALWIFGDNVEDRLGHGTYLFFYLLCGVAAALTQVVFSPDQAQPTIGASGAIAGILGAYVMLFPHAKVMTLIPIGFIPWFIRIPAYFYLGFWFVVQAFTGWVSLHGTHSQEAAESVAWFAHIGGFITGFVLVRLFQRSDYPPWHRDEYMPY